MGFFFPQFSGSDFALGYGFGLKNPAGEVMEKPQPHRAVRNCEGRPAAWRIAD